MLRRTVSSLTASSSKILHDQENEFSFDSSAQNLMTPSPNRSKYEGKFGKRRPLGEKTNKNTQNSIKLKEASGKTEEKKQNEEKTEKSNSSAKEKKTEDSTHNNSNVSASNVSFEDLFHLNESHSKSEKQGDHNTKIEELSMALSETLQENEQLHDTVSLLKAEINRLNEELLEYKEYAELYLLGKELIENQAEEIENLKKKLVKRSD